MKSIFEKSGGVYRCENGIYFPDLTIDKQEPLGRWGREREKYLKEYRPMIFSVMQTTGKIYDHLQETDKTANERYFRLISDMTQAEGISERLKSENQLEWVAAMNSIRNRAAEIIMYELIVE